MQFVRHIDGPVRALLWLAFFSVVLCAWVMLFVMARGLGLDALCLAPADLAFSLRAFSTVWTMWAVMAAAMMLPTMIPTLLAYDDLIASVGARAGADRLGWLGVAGGYLGVWVATSAGFASAQILLASAGWLDAAGVLVLARSGGALLLIAGIWQFSRTKAECQSVCLSPSMYFLKNWQAGGAGGVRMGAGLGAFCVTCCWALMALAFVGGVMNLAFMGVATALMVIEKLPDIGQRITRPVGSMLIAAGLIVLVWPQAIFGG